MDSKKNSQEHQELVKERFGDNAQAYAVSPVHASGWSLKRMLELVNPQPGWHVLDIATGAGHTAMAFAPYVFQVLATDITPRMLEVAKGLAEERQLANIRFELADAERLPYQAGSFDLVTCRIAPHHFSLIDRFVAECARVLKRPGILAVADNVVPQDEQAASFINQFERERDPSHQRSLSDNEWLDLLVCEGFQLMKVETSAKAIDFDLWTGNQNVPQAGKDHLRQMLANAPKPARDFLAPRFEGDKVFFNLAESVFIARITD